MTPRAAAGKRGIALVMLLFLAALVAHGQNLILTNNTQISGTGVIKVQGNIVDSSLTRIDTLHGAVYLTGTVVTGAQTVGSSNGAHPGLMFDTLRIDSAGAKSLNTNVQVGGSFYFWTTGGTLTLNAHRLTIDGATARYGGTLNANTAGDSVIYDGASGAQHIIDATYKGLNITGAAAKDLLGRVIDNGYVSHTGGALTVNNGSFYATGGYSFSTITTVNAADSLVLGSTAGSIATVADVAGGGYIVNGAGLLTITSLTNNHGTLSAATNGGPMTLNTVTTNNGSILGGAGSVTIATLTDNKAAITGGAGQVSFTNAAATSGGTITPGAGGMVFNQLATVNSGGTITSPLRADSLRFVNGLTVNNGGSFTLTVNGAATLAGTFTKGATATVTFSAPSLFTYNGAAPPIIGGLSYGNLTLAGSGIANIPTGGLVTVVDTLRLSQSVTVADSLIFNAATGANVASAGEVLGKVTRAHSFTAGNLYTFNRDSVALQFSTTAARIVTINMTPGADPTDVSTLNRNYVKRRYALYDNTLASDTLTKMILYYLPAEIQNGALYSSMGILSDTNTIWGKVTGPGLTTFDGSDAVALSNLKSILASVKEFAIAYTPVVTVQTGDWGAGTTWDKGSTPAATDQTEVRHAVTVNSAGMVAQSVVVDLGKSVTFGASGVLTVGGVFNLNSGPGAAGLTLVSGSKLILQNGGYMIMNGKIANSGLIDIR